MRLRALARPALLVVAAIGLATTLVISGGTGAGAKPARLAGVEYGQPNMFCLYRDTWFRPPESELCFSKAALAYGRNLGDYNFDDTASSIVNNLDVTVCFYTGSNYTGEQGLLSRYSFWANLTKNYLPGNRTWNDKISSVRTGC